MKIFRVTLSIITGNTMLFFRIIIAKLMVLQPLPKSLAWKRINGILFEFDFKYDSAIKLMHSGSYEVPTLEAMRRYLNKGDTFIDVGANIGYLSAITLGPGRQEWAGA
ncbi:hypothetical protein ACFLT8_05610 [Chloroflexota bacterium]